MNTPIDLPPLPAHPDPHAFNWSKAELRSIKAYARAAVLADRAALAQPVQPTVENIREGAPYDNSKFEELCRNYGIWGTAEAALCAAFWQSATAQPVPPQEPVGHLYTIAGLQHCTIEKVLPDGPLYTQPVQPARPASFIDHAYATAAVITDRAQPVQPAARACKYPDCAENGPEGKCIDWLTGACPGPSK